MRILVLAFLAAGCVQQPPAPRAPVVCEPPAVLNEGRNARRYPANCPDDPALVERYNLGLRIAELEEELREVNYRVASRDGRGPIGAISSPRRFGFGSSGFLISRRIEIKNELRYLKREAGLSK